MIRLFIVANNLAGGGAEKLLIMLLNVLKPPTYSVDLLLIKNKGVYLDAIPQHVRMKTMLDVTNGNQPFPTEPAVLEAYCREHIPSYYDVEIAFLEGPPTKLIAHHANTRAYKIAWVHTDLQNVHWTYAYYHSDDEERSTYKLFDEIVFVSEGAQQAFFQRFGLRSKPCMVITNPTDIADIQNKANAFQVQTYPFCFCTVGSLCARKGQSRLLHSMGRLFAEGFRFHLNLVGDGDTRKFLQELANLLNIKRYVHFIGFQINPYPFMAHCDVILSSSLSEGFPLVLCEALCLQKPIIATKCVGNSDVLHDGSFGMLVDNTEEGISQGMRQVLSDRFILEDLARKAREGFLSLQYDAVFEQIHDLLQKRGSARDEN